MISEGDGEHMGHIDTLIGDGQLKLMCEFLAFGRTERQARSAALEGATSSLVLWADLGGQELPML